jgi:hypothetical protein
MEIYEHDESSLTALTAEIAALGYDAATAEHYAVLIGDTPLRDDDGRIVVMANGVELARLPLKFFDEVCIIDGDWFSPWHEAMTALSEKEAERLLARDDFEGVPPLPEDLGNAIHEYTEDFDNFREVSNAQLVFDPRFPKLLRLAVARGRALDRDEVSRAFPKVEWD